MHNRTHSAAPEPAQRAPAPPPTPLTAAVAGIRAGATVPGVAHPVAALFATDAAPVQVIGATVADTTPRPL
ncbi:hypothetical protein [Nocardia cyriacigeorgica]|uniref:hypothetical protein n=1 Tax=Nocardia cyriacigeorgica TaxID=135487 RepID=UPI0024577F91|nr:hypothetical protein [Nocardia cyriacigeorgica]